MRIFTDPEEFRQQCRQWRKAGETIALVPTMGYFHAGHRSLMRYGRDIADRLVVSLFVNPTQFGPNEDLAAYPRDFERDCAIAAAEGADALFAPAEGSMYSPDHATWVEAPELARRLCGVSRPVHFRGVCTVVLKLLLLSGADYAIFGEKDWQQQAIIKAMARDLNLDARIIARPTVREGDGLALSSRNAYLGESERARAPNIRRALEQARDLAQGGETSASRLKEAVSGFWQETLPGARVDYLEIVHPQTLETLTEVSGPGLMACAVWIGGARLIDNILLQEGREA